MKLSSLFEIIFIIILQGCSPIINTVTNKTSLINKPSFTIQSPKSTMTETRLPTRTRVPTSTVTLTPNNSSIIQLKSIYEYLLTNKDDLKNNPQSSWVFQHVDINVQVISKPYITELCQLDCVSITWDKRVTISLYLMWNKDYSQYNIEVLKVKLFEKYPFMEVNDPEELNLVLKSILPDYKGWASIVYLQGYWYTEYFATYYGPIIILISRTTACADGCEFGDPIPQIYLAKMQLEKIFKLTQ